MIGFSLLLLAALAVLAPSALRARPVLAARLGALALTVVAVATAIAWGRSTTSQLRWVWIEPLGLEVHLAVDSFAALMVCLVAGLGALVLWYSADYFPEHRAYSQFIGYFLAFAAAMTGLVASADLFTMFVFWELTSVFSFLLIGMNDESATARSAAVRALLTTGLGGLCLLVGVALFQVAAGTSSFAALAAVEDGGALFTAGAMFVLVGALTKSAQFPFHFWLPGAMSAPTPVSAYLHSATMVKAGIVLMARMFPVVDGIAAWRWLVVVLGGVTMVQGGVRALRQFDAKLLLAHSTVSQLGFLAVLVGLGTPTALYAGIAHLAAHALFKAGLFLSVGIVDHATGTRDLRMLNGVGRQMPLVAGLTTVSAASMAGLIPFLGFATKEKALAALLHHPFDDGGLGAVALCFVVIGAVLSAAYSVRIVRGMFGTTAHVPVSLVDHAPGAGLVVPMGITVVGTVMGGLAAGWWGSVLVDVARSLEPTAKGALALWPGVNTALFVSVAVLAIGGAIGWRSTGAVHTGGTVATAGRARRFTGERAFEAVYDGLLAGSAHITRYTQSGSLSIYTLVVMAIMALALAVPVVGLLGDGEIDLILADSPLQLAVSVLAVTFAIGAAAMTRRFHSAMLAGGLGFCCAAIFVMFGAPDLALTQLLVEGLVVVVLVLVLRQLPVHFDIDRNWIPRAARLAVSAAVGLAVAMFALYASSSRTAPSVGGDYLERSVPEGGGNNVVNVILVDFRGVDTLGEITVLMVAGLGIANLVRIGRLRRTQDAAVGRKSSS